MDATYYRLMYLMPALIWLHSKKHSEGDAGGQWHRAWNTMAGLLYPERYYALKDLEHAVHEAIGIPTDNCSCEVCHA